VCILQHPSYYIKIYIQRERERERERESRKLKCSHCLLQLVLMLGS
ncbi:unnamed protein product, partial [Musa hybrid cultivar]